MLVCLIHVLLGCSGTARNIFENIGRQGTCTIQLHQCPAYVTPSVPINVTITLASNQIEKYRRYK